MHLMRQRRSRRWRPALAALVAITALPGMALAQKATISGRVTTVGTGQPVAFGQVFVVGTNVGASTDEQGRYVIPNAPTGTLEVRVVRIGYEEMKKPVTVTAGQNVTLDFEMKAVAVQLQQVVTTATGKELRVALGNSVADLGNVAKNVETKPVTDLTDLMVAKAPGVTVLPGNMTGSAPTIRIRGLSSISLNNAPIYVIDGVRMTSDAISMGTGGTTASYLNTLNPEEIANIEIVKGPAAATLYGTDAANGVVVITTKTGQVGAPRWTFHAEGGLVQDRNNYPTQYAIWGHDPTNPAKITRCVLVTIASGACAADSTTSLNIFSAPDLTPLATGNRTQYGAQVSGGTAAVRYFVSGDLEKEIGPVAMPGFGIQYFDSLKIPVRDEWKHPEAFQRNSFRANLNMSLSPTFDLAVATSFGNTNQRLPQVDNNLFSYLYNAFSNPGFRGPGLGFSDVGGLGEDLHSYRNFTPAQIFQILSQDVINRYIGSINADWRPFTWMQNNATVGLDFADRNLLEMCRFGECVAFGDTRQGYVYNSRTNARNYSVKANSTMEWQVNPMFNLKTTIGLDYTNEGTEFASGEGDHLPPGGQGAGQGAIQIANSSLLRADKTMGFFAQELVTINDRIYITGGVRTDQNSAFGTDFQRVFYPKAQLSWNISDEGFFPHFSWLNQLHLRSAYGASGVQPGPTDAMVTYRSATTNIASIPGEVNGVDTPALLADGLGNAKLKPETSKEWEAGFDSQLLNNRMSVEFTYYHRQTKDALIRQQIAASSGASSLSVLENLASTQNKGIEASLNATILDMPAIGWDITIAGSHNSNKILSLGLDPSGNPNPTIRAAAERFDSVGMPINGYYARGFTYSDANGDGIISQSEVQVDPNFSYIGQSIAPNIASFTTGVDLLHRKLRLTALLDYKGGYKLFNNTTSFYCQQTNQCYDETHKTASLYDQARLVAERYGAGGLRTDAGYYDDGSFWRLREVSANLLLPGKWMQVVHAHDASLTFSARNLHVWTKYTGVDPESNYGTDDVQTDFSTTAPPTYFTLRLNLHY